MTDAKTETKPATKSLKVFRNASARIFYLKDRVQREEGDQPQNFAFGPGMTVQAMDAKEEALLESRHPEIIDVAKEAPQVGENISALHKQLTEEQAKNAELLKKHDLLTSKIEELNSKLDKKNR